ncbi:IS200/IS605 family transposase [Algoriphagus aestuarii]|nr:IS200/IS605 family transposase [Algoriphagus aestuarii]
MANTYTQIHIQFVFVTMYRMAFISENWEIRLFEYITSIIQNNKHKVLAINGTKDHIHVLIGLRPDQSISELAQMVKASSSKWINEEKLTKIKFYWQEGFGAFSYTKSDIEKVVKYIVNQKEHHKKNSFLEEYKNVLQKLEIDFDPKYIFHEPE